MIETEFGLINISREAALSFTTEGNVKDFSSIEKQKILTNNGQQFKWNNLDKKRPIFIECSAIENEKENNQFNLNPLREWISEKCCLF
jgi:hypothetical protein